MVGSQNLKKSRMLWFWRIVCSPGCTDFCKRLCPGCELLGEEWQAYGVLQPRGSLPRFPFAWRRLKLRWIYWYRLLNGGPVSERGALACGPDCGCSQSSPTVSDSGILVPTLVKHPDRPQDDSR